MFFGTDLSAGDALCDSAAGIAPYAAAFGERVHHALEDSSLLSVIAVAELAYVQNTITVGIRFMKNRFTPPP